MPDEPRYRVTMTEEVMYVHDYSASELAELMGVIDVADAITTIENEGADATDTWLLDDVMEHFHAVTERNYEIEEVSDESVPKVRVDPTPV